MTSCLRARTSTPPPARRPRPCAPAGLRRLVARVADEVLAPHGAQQRMPHLLLREHEHVVVGTAGVAAIRRAGHAGAELVSRPLHRLAQPLVVAEAHPNQVHHRVLHRHLDLLTFAGHRALHERGEDPDHAVHAGPRIANGRPHVRRRPVGEPGDAHRAAHGLRDGLVALVVGVRSVRPEPLDARVHQPRVQRAHHRVAEAQTIEHTRAEVLEQHVRRLEQGAEHLLGARVPSDSAGGCACWR